MRVGGLAFLIGLAVSGTASAASIVVTGGFGEGLVLESGTMSSLFRGARGHAWNGAELATVHDALRSDGVDTNGRITLMPVETSRGLSLLTLIDEPTGGAMGGLEQVGMTSTTSADGGFFINDVRGEDMTIETGDTGRTVDVDFRWRENRGDAFAWTRLESGDDVSYEFTTLSEIGLGDREAFQFVTWTRDGWRNAGNFGASLPVTSFAVVPLPPALLLGMAGLGIVGVYRRRFRRMGATDA